MAALATQLLTNAVGSAIFTSTFKTDASNRAALNPPAGAPGPLPTGFATVRDAYASKVFREQFITTLIINFGINFGWEWGAMTHWGGNKNDPTWEDRMAKWPTINAWGPFDSGQHGVNSCLALDMLLSTFLIGYMCMLLATDGTKKEVRKKKCATLAPELIQGGWWRYTPVPIKNLCLRSCATGAYVTLLIGIPSFLIVWASIGSGNMPGLPYTIFKSIWCTAVSGVVYALVFPAAINKANFPELEFEELMGLAATGENKDGGDMSPIPLVAQPALI